MNFLPFENVSYISNLPPQEVLHRLQEVTEPRVVFRFWPAFGKKDFEGEISDQEFNIRPLSWYQNNLRPEIHGKVKASGMRTKISVDMKLNSFTMLSFVFWLVTALVVTIVGLIPMNENPINKSLLNLSVPFLIIGYILLIGFFNWGTRKVKTRLEKLFEARLE